MKDHLETISPTFLLSPFTTETSEPLDTNERDENAVLD